MLVFKVAEHNFRYLCNLCFIYLSLKNPDPLVGKNGSGRDKNQNFNFLFINIADVCAVAMAT